MPTLAIDLLGFNGRRGGTETYAREISTRLPDHLPGVDLVALAGEPGAALVRHFFPGEVRVVPRVGYSPSSWAAAELGKVERAARAAGADALWNPANFGPVVRGLPRVLTVHDVIYHELPGKSVSRRVTGLLMKWTAAKADALIAISRATAAAASRALDIPESRFRVIPNGTAAPSAPPSTMPDLVAGLPQGRSVVLSMGNRLPHKNFESLIAAVAMLPAERRPLTVIPGGQTPDPLAATVRELGVEDDVLLPGWVDSATLEALYARASAYVCPSLSEGFGLPVLDAFTRGCTVIANDVPALREVGGPFAHYTDASSAQALADAISQVIASPDPADRRAAAREWAARFTWEASAAATAAVLREQLDRGERPRA